MADPVQPESAVALVHVLTQPAAFTRRTFQLARFWLKAVAELNMLCILATDATFQPPMGWLNAVAEWKVKDSVMTRATSQPPTRTC